MTATDSPDSTINLTEADGLEEEFNSKFSKDDTLRLVLGADGKVYLWTSTGMDAPELGNLLIEMGEHFKHGTVNRVG